MFTHYIKKALKIFREKGPIELLTRSTKCIFEYLLTVFDPQYYRRFKFHTWKNHWQNRIKFDAPSNPYKTINIRPSEVEDRVGYTHRARTVPSVRTKGISQIKSGDWDTNRNNVTNSFIICGIIEHFEKNKKWKDTVYYNHIYKKYNKNCDKYENKGFDSLDDYLQENFNSVECLFDKIKYDGYKPKHNGQHIRPGSTQPVRNKLEVLVTIDRQGKINFYEGNHRFGIARVLDIEIPVQVVCRHRKWQEIRDEIYNNGLSEEYEYLRNHPDLQDIID